MDWNTRPGAGPIGGFSCFLVGGPKRPLASHIRATSKRTSDESCSSEFSKNFSVAEAEERGRYFIISQSHIAAQNIRYWRETDSVSASRDVRSLGQSRSSAEAPTLPFLAQNSRPGRLFSGRLVRATSRRSVRVHRQGELKSSTMGYVCRGPQPTTVGFDN
jgi:hypothetical protein